MFGAKIGIFSISLEGFWGENGLTAGSGRQSVCEGCPFIKKTQDICPCLPRTTGIGEPVLVICPVKMGDHHLFHISTWFLKLQKLLHFHAPQLPFIGIADLAEMVDSAQNFRKPDHILVTCGTPPSPKGRLG